MSRVNIPEFHDKLELLRRSAPVLDFASRNGSTVPTETDLCKWMHLRGGTPLALDRSELSRASGNGKYKDSLTSEHARSFLIAFGVSGVPTGLDVPAPDNQAWLSLLNEPVEAFRSRIMLAGGECAGPPPGERWDRFFTAERRKLANEVGSRMVSLLRRGVTREQPANGFDRALPPGAPSPILKPDETGQPQVIVGEKIAFQLDPGKAGLRPSPFCHLFVVQEVRTGGERVFLPLLPYPGDFGAIMPSTSVETKPVSIPADPARHALEVPPNWGAQRSILVVVTPRALEPQICVTEDTRDVVRSERMDLLATRLQKSGVEFAIARFSYLVRPIAPP